MGECPRVSESIGASELLDSSEPDVSTPLSPSSERLAYAALGELAAEGVSTAREEVVCKCDGM